MTETDWLSEGELQVLHEHNDDMDLCQKMTKIYTIIVLRHLRV
jgi:hypothetical protein